MLTTILNNLPSPKFVVIQDSLVLQGSNILLSIIKAHLDIKKSDIHYFCFEGNPEKLKIKFFGDKYHVYDYLTDNNGWLDSNPKNFLEFVEKNKLTGIIVIDSLSTFILEHGLSQTYKILHKLSNKVGIIQIATVLHVDSLENKLETLKFIEHLSTLNLKLDLVSNSTRVEYRHRKPGGKLIKKVEEYYFEDNIFRTRALEKVDAAKLLGPTKPETLPENLSTFKISLDENEKKSREGLTLPYMAKSNIGQDGNSGGSVIYNLDDDDDWDDEDPDDDLDI